MSKQENTDKPQKKKGGGFMGLIIGLALASAFLLPTEMLLLIGMVPTIVMAIADPSSDRRGAIAVGVPNLAGVLPFLIELWKHNGGVGHSMAPAIAILMQPLTFMIMYGAAGCGSAIYFYVPKAVSQFTAFRAQSEIAGRRALQKKLEAQWGTDIAAKPKKK